MRKYWESRRGEQKAMTLHPSAWDGTDRLQIMNIPQIDLVGGGFTQVL